MKITITALFAALVLLIPLFVTQAFASFPDVPSDYLYYDAINYVQTEEVVSGFTDGTYRPEDPITRAEFTKIIVNANLPSVKDGIDLALGYPEVAYDVNGPVYLVRIPEDDPNNFTGSEILYYEQCIYYKGYADGGDEVLSVVPVFNDIQADHLFANYLCYAKEMDIVGGYTDGNFYPDNPITVGEASKIIANAYGLTDLDSGPEGDIFKPFIDALVEQNAIPETVIDIDDILTRGEMAAFVYYLETDNDSSVDIN
ncbi:S-layer homology domain-containing protein [Candidatus Dojkabacteria bacterium]|uniref:S-layer homology domain-containing protein n=1 Tax=Candidatus Dojkabacteria bacterium TaxID=2099670 RepID=A0A955L6X4_9BACT|nr:S-layer homology domain-containing protein [Candidatus Dojkabacteria bacterium]